MFNDVYYEVEFTPNKDTIPRMVCRMKEKILLEHEQDVRIEKEIELIKDKLGDCE